jgi:hypothetical protein
VREAARRLDVELAPAREVVDEHDAREGARAGRPGHVGGDGRSTVALEGHVLAAHASVERHRSSSDPPPRARVLVFHRASWAPRRRRQAGRTPPRPGAVAARVFDGRTPGATTGRRRAPSAARGDTPSSSGCGRAWARRVIRSSRDGDEDGAQLRAAGERRARARAPAAPTGSDVLVLGGGAQRWAAAEACTLARCAPGPRPPWPVRFPPFCDYRVGQSRRGVTRLMHQAVRQGRSGASAGVGRGAAAATCARQGSGPRGAPPGLARAPTTPPRPYRAAPSTASRRRSTKPTIRRV